MHAREQPDETRRVMPRRVAPADVAARRTSLARHRVGAQRRRASRALFDHAEQHVGQLVRHRRRHDAPHRAPLVPPAHRPVGAAHLAHQRRLEQHAAVGEHGVGGRELEWRHRQLVPHREARRTLLRPRARGAEPAGRLTRQLDAGRRAEAEVAQPLELLDRREPRTELRDPDVARQSDHVRQRDRRRRVHVVDHPVAERVAPVLGEDRVVRRRLARTQQRGRREHLRRRARLEHVAHRGTRRSAAPHARERQDLPGARLEDHDVAARGVRVRDRLGQRPVRDLLQLGVEREHDVHAVHRLGRWARGRGVGAAPVVAQHHRRPSPAREQRVESALQPARPPALRVHPPHDPRREIGPRVEALQPPPQVYAAQVLERRHRAPPVGARPLHPDAAGVQRRGDRLARLRELPREERRRPARVVHLARRHADPERLLRQGERHPIAVVERAPPRRQRDARGLLGRGARAPLLALGELQLRRPAHDRQRGRAESGRDQGDARR